MDRRDNAFQVESCRGTGLLLQASPPVSCRTCRAIISAKAGINSELHSKLSPPKPRDESALNPHLLALISSAFPIHRFLPRRLMASACIRQVFTTKESKYTLSSVRKLPPNASIPLQYLSSILSAFSSFYSCFGYLLAYNRFAEKCCSYAEMLDQADRSLLQCII